MGIQSGGARYGLKYVMFDVGIQFVHAMGSWQGFIEWVLRWCSGWGYRL